MGRFYKTAKPEFVRDNVYTPPVELMAKVIGNTDLARDNYETAKAALAEKLKAEALKPDEGRLKNVVNDYHNKIDEMAKEIQGGSLNFGNQMSKLRELGRDISDNWTTGEVGKMQENKKEYDEGVKRDMERLKASKGYITEEDRAAIEKYNIDQFAQNGGTSYEGPSKYNKLNYEQTASYYDLNNKLDEFGKGFRVEGFDYSYDKARGQWIETHNNKSNGVSYEKVAGAMKKYLDSDKEYQDYNSQQMKVGLNTQDGLNAKEAAALIANASKHSGFVTDTSTSLKENQAWKWNYDASQSQTKETTNLIGMTSPSAAKNYEMSANARLYEYKTLHELTDGVKDPHTGKPFHFNSISDAITHVGEMAKKDPKLKPLLNKLQGVRNDTKEAMRASYEPLVTVFGFKREESDDFQKRLNDFSKDHFQAMHFYQPERDFVDKDGRRHVVTLKKDQQNFTPKGQMGQIQFAPNGERVMIKNVTFEENSVIPVLVNGVREKDRNSITHNDANCVLKYAAVRVDKDGKEIDKDNPVYFTKEAFFDMHKETGITIMQNNRQ